MSARSKPPDLMFLESTDSVGFTAASVTAFRELSPSAIVRELIQNSLDAVQSTAETKAVVRFRLSRIQTSEIPGIESYQRAFKRAVKRRQKETDGTLPDQEQMIVDRIRDALDEGMQDVLTVIDNGAGLDQITMGAILSDGKSHKSNGASGAFGNGHLSVFPASDLRYVLYGGINGKKWTSSGHAVLASHDKDDKDEIGCSASGYYLAGRKGRFHQYSDRSTTPPIIKKILEEIESTVGHGTAVIVPAFNYFRESPDDVFKAIQIATSCSFFSAIHDEKLEVVIEDRREGNGKSSDRTTDSKNLHSILGKFQDQKRNKDFLSGFKANLAYKAISEGKSHDVPVSGEHVHLHLLQSDAFERTRVNLCRNGMWITNSDMPTGGIPRFYNAFGDRKTFEAVISVTGGKKGAKRFHNLIRKAEGPLHNRLDTKALAKDEANELRSAFGQIKDWLRENVPEVSGDWFSPDDFLNFSEDPEGEGESKMPGYHFQGILTPMRRRSSSLQRNVDATGGLRALPSGKGKGTEKRKGAGREGTRRRPALPAHFTAVAAPQGSEKRKIVIRCTKDSENMELRLFVNENTDPTTDKIWKDENVIIKGATINGKSVNKGDIIDGDHPGLRLGDLKGGTTTEVVVECAFNGRERIRSGESMAPSLRVEIGKVPEGEQRA